MRARSNASTVAPTRYEIVATNGKQAFRVGFARDQSRRSLVTAMRLKAKEIIQRCGVGEHDHVTFGYERRGLNTCAYAVLGNGWRIGFSGRTEQEVTVD